MSGFFGAWHLAGRPADTAQLGHCLDRITPRGLRGAAFWSDAGIGLGIKPSAAVSLADTASPLFATGDRVCLIEGRLDNRSELLRALSDHPFAGSSSSNASLTLAAYEAFGDRFADRIKGDVSVCVYDRTAKRVVLVRDRVGLRPICYAQVGSTLLFGSEAKALLAFPGVETRPDEALLADFVLYFLAGDGRSRTFFDGIHSLPPGHLLIASPEGVRVDRYFEFDAERRLTLASFPDYVDAFRSLFAASVRNRMRGATPAAISVSGGLDSSYIFCVAQQLLRDDPSLCPAAPGFNFGGAPGSSSDERTFVELLERTTGESIARIPQQPGFVECASHEVYSSESPAVEGLATLRQAFLGTVASTGARRLLTGHWGDQVLSDRMYLADLAREGHWTLFNRHRAGWKMSASSMASLLARDLAGRYAPHAVHAALRRLRRTNGAWTFPWFTPHFRQRLLERFNAERLPRVAGSSHAWSIYQQVRNGYHLQCMEWNTRVGAMHDIDSAFPYLDCDLIQFLMSIPGHIQSHDGARRGLMRAAMRGTVPDAIIDRRGKGEFTSLGNEGIESDYAAIADLFGPSATSVRLGYVDDAVVRTMLQQWRPAIRDAGDPLLSDRVIDLCGLELLLSRFFSHTA